jgi:hypothetical protein
VRTELTFQVAIRIDNQAEREWEEGDEARDDDNVETVGNRREIGSIRCALGACQLP